MVVIRNKEGDIVYRIDLKEYRVFDPRAGKYRYGGVAVRDNTVIVMDAFQRLVEARQLNPGETVHRC